jgi:hypothetical protein
MVSGFVLATLGVFFVSCSQVRSADGSPYFVDAGAEHADDLGPGTKDKPWKSLSGLKNRKLSPGDTIYFASGLYHGNAEISDSGSPDRPIVFTHSGEGPVPVFSNTNFDDHNGNVFLIKGSNVVIDGLQFVKCAASTSKEDRRILVVGAIFASTGADHLTVENCEFIDCPIGININSQHCLLTKNKLRDCNRFLSEPDWGPLGILVGNAFNEISYNVCSNYVKVGGNYGADGGFIELDDRYFGNKVHDVKIHHNESFNNQGFLEIEGKVKGSRLDVYYNVSNDFQQFIFYWGGDSSKVENNTVIRTLPANHGSVNTVFTMRNPTFTVRNNIFVVANGIQVWVTAPYDVANYSKVKRENNIYYCTDGTAKDPCGRPLGTGEVVADPQFVAFPGDLHLRASSPAIDHGIGIGYRLDFEGTPLPVGNLPDVGAFEFH